MWTHLTNIGTLRDSPWFLTGDFYEIIDNSGKQGGSLRPESSFVDFRSFLSECDLYDLPHSGNFYSWRGERYDHTILCRLDRAMGNCS